MNEQQQELNERIADDERHAATMRKAYDYDALAARLEVLESAFDNSHQLNEQLGDDNRAALARAEAAEALAYERLENMLFAEQRATDADLRAEAAEAEAADAILAASDAAQREENAMHALSHFRTRVAELEAQLAAQGWRPVTEDWPPYAKSVPVRMRDGVVRWGYRHGDRWHLTGGQYSRESVTHAYALPPAAAEATE